MNKHLKLLRSIIYILPGIMLMISLWVYVNPSGKKTLSYHIGSSSPMISAFFPAQRLISSSVRSQSATAMPIYFTVRYPHQYESAIIRLVVTKQLPSTVMIGLDVNDVKEWAYDLHKPDTDQAFRFDLHNARIQDGKIRFMISVDPADIQDFEIQGVSVELNRPPLVTFIQSKILGL